MYNRILNVCLLTWQLCIQEFFFKKISEYVDKTHVINNVHNVLNDNSRL